VVNIIREDEAYHGKIRLMKIVSRTILWLTSFEKTRFTMEKLGKTLMKMSHDESRNDKESSDV